MKIAKNNRLSAVIAGSIVLYPGTNVVPDTFGKEAELLMSCGVVELFEHADKLPDYKQIQLIRDCNSVNVAKKLPSLLRAGMKTEIRNRISVLEDFISRVEKSKDDGAKHV